MKTPAKYRPIFRSGVFRVPKLKETWLSPGSECYDPDRGYQPFTARTQDHKTAQLWERLAVLFGMPTMDHMNPIYYLGMKWDLITSRIVHRNHKRIDGDHIVDEPCNTRVFELDLDDVLKKVINELTKFEQLPQDKIREHLVRVNTTHAKLQEVVFHFDGLDLDSPAEYPKAGDYVYSIENDERRIQGIWQAGAEMASAGERGATYQRRKDGGIGLHPAISHLAGDNYVVASKPNQPPRRFDTVEYTRHWGLCAGIVPFSTNAQLLGYMLGAIFANNPDLYHDRSVGVYTNEYGALTNYYGWPLSGSELRSGNTIANLRKLLGNPAHQASQIHVANSLFKRMLKEWDLRYIATPGMEVWYGEMFMLFLSLNPDDVADCGIFSYEHSAFKRCSPEKYEEYLANLLNNLRVLRIDKQVRFHSSPDYTNISSV